LPVEINIELVRDIHGNPMHIQSVVRDITTRKQAEAALRESEKRYRDLVNEIADGVYSTDEQGRLSFANLALGRMLGFEHPGEVIGHNFLEFVTPNMRNVIEQRYAVALQGKATRKFEVEVFRKDGTLAYLESNPVLIIQNGQAVGSRGIITDITERKKIELFLQNVNTELEQRVAERTAEVRQSEEKFAKVFYESPIARAIGREGMVFVDVNDRYLELFECSREEIIGHTSAEFNFFPDAHERAEIARILFDEQGSLNNFEAHARTLSGKEIVLLLSTTAIYLNGLKHEMVVYVDITERKHLENELRESEQKYTTLFEESAVPTVLLQLPEVRILNSNAACEKLTGYSRAEMFGKTAVELGLYQPSERAQLIAAFEKQGELSGDEIRLVTKTGEARLVFVKTVSVMIGGQLCAISTLTDITARKQAEEHLAETNLALEKALHAKDEFMAAMSHELRTPLTGILAMSEALQLLTYGSLTEKQSKYVDMIHESGNRLLELINDVLEYTRLQGGKEKPATNSCSLENACHLALQSIARKAAARQQHFQFSAVPQGIVLLTDERRLNRLLLHLLDNASKFTQPAREIGIEVRGRAAEKLVAVTVWDTGIGIKEADMPRLFQPFVQLDARLSRQYGGTGLGLVLAQGLAEMLGGNIIVESVFGQGSRFTVLLPWAGV